MHPPVVTLHALRTKNDVSIPSPSRTNLPVKLSLLEESDWLAAASGNGAIGS
jgi:hypothetical protein